MKYKNVVWDWNGTLLNDVKVGVNTLNDMLGRRGLPLLSVEDYKEKFGFPVIDFYDRVGFDMEKESFHELSVDFVETYDKYAGEVGLNEGVREVLAGIQQTGVKQYVLSALREDLLQQMLRHFQIGKQVVALHCVSDFVHHQNSFRFRCLYCNRLFHSLQMCDFVGQGIILFWRFPQAPFSQYGW